MDVDLRTGQSSSSTRGSAAGRGTGQNTPTPASERPKSLGRYMAETSARRQQAQINELFGLKKGGKVKKYAKGGKIDGCAVRGKTRAARKTPMKKGK